MKEVARPVLLIPAIKTAISDHQSVIAAKAAIQSYQGFSWIPALASAGMTKIDLRSTIALFIQKSIPVEKDGIPWDQSRGRHVTKVVFQECNRCR